MMMIPVNWMVTFARIGITTLAWAATSVALLAAGCGVSDKELRSARAVSYDTEYGLVYSEVLAAVADQYPDFVQDSGARGTVRTPWFPVRLATNEDEPIPTRPGLGLSSGVSSGQKRFYVRFDVELRGGRPWQVRVVGQASSWAIGQGVPVVLTGNDEPTWLKGRVDALHIAIHRRLEQFAVASVAPANRDRAPEPAATEATSANALFGQLPAPAARAAEAVWRAARARDLEALRAHLHDAFLWSPGAPPSARDALVLWQADPSLLDALVAALEGGCEAEPDRVTCPAQATLTSAPARGLGPSRASGYQARFQPGPDGIWKLSAFAQQLPP